MTIYDILGGSLHSSTTRLPNTKVVNILQLFHDCGCPWIRINGSIELTMMMDVIGTRFGGIHIRNPISDYSRRSDYLFITALKDEYNFY